MRVATSSGMTGRVLNLTVRPVTGGTVKYEMDHVNGKVLVAALEGKLRINDGRQAMILEPGKVVSMPVPQADAVASGSVCSAGKHQEIVSGQWTCVDDLPEGGGSNKPVGAVGLNLSGVQIGLITGVAIAGGAGAAFGIARALSPGVASPAR
jgi:hypothetical protein